MAFLALQASLLLAAVLAVQVTAETHTVHFDNRCGFGTPILIQGGIILSTGGDYVSNGPLLDAIAYLQTGACGSNGEGCATVEINLGGAQNPCSTPTEGTPIECTTDNVNVVITFCP